MNSSKVIIKILSIILVLTMLFSLTACGSAKEESEYTVDENVVSEYNETRAAEVYGSFASEVEALYEEEHEDESSKNNVANDYDITYLGWTYFEYATAKESEKNNCAKAYLGYIGDLLGLSVSEPDEETLEEVKDALAKALKNNEDLSVQEIVLYFYASEESESADE